MCVGRPRAPKPQPLPAPPPIMSRTNPQESSPLPEKRDVVGAEDVAEVEYGGNSKKDATPSGGNRKGSDSLKIDLDQGSATGGTPSL